jgi:hypothetical protein
MYEAGIYILNNSETEQEDLGGLSGISVSVPKR